MKTSKKIERSINESSGILDYIDKNITDNLTKLFQKIKSHDEFEFIFFGRNGTFLQQEKYIKLLKNISRRATTQNLTFVEPHDILDITYNAGDGIGIRCSINGQSEINKIMKKLNIPKNHVVFKTLVELKFKKKDMFENMTFMKKEKNSDNVVDIDEFDIRARLSHETDLSADDIEMCLNIDEKSMESIKFRYKQRTSLFVLGNEKSDEFIRIDITFTRNSNSFKNINVVVPNYELEIEYGTKTKSDPSKLDVMIKEAEILLKIINQSNHLIPKSTKLGVYTYYKNLLFISNENITTLDARQAITLEIQHVTEVLPNRYAVTDKADGDRNFLIVFNKKVYLMSTNMGINYTGIELKNNDYDGSLVDGELIFIPKKNRHIFLIFDCLFYKSEDVRKTIKLADRLAYADDIVNKCFIFGKQIGFIPNAEVIDKTFNLAKKTTFHHNEIKRMIDALNIDIELEKQFVLIRRKYFIMAQGGHDWEIFAYASTIWNAFTVNSLIKCPYFLDGLIFQPLEQAYVTNINESRYQDFKWKPPEKNSIDFYVEFEKDKDGKILTVYDNSYDDEDYVKDKSYKICRLYCGQRNKGTEVPVLFREEDELYYAYIYVTDGEVRDVENNIISDKTVVEFYYNNDPDILDRFKWVALRTRYDKTESVARFKKKYGNASVVANKIWRSILNPVIMSDLDDLAVGNNSEKNIYTYDKKVALLKTKITDELIITATTENKYFQKITDLAKPMRNFINWIKSNMIYTYCHPMYQDNRQLSVLDIGCGKGQDIMKYYYSMVLFLVAIDSDRQGLVSGTDGAVSRYNKFKYKKPNFPKMHFVQADATAEFDVELQHKALNVKKLENEDMFKKFFTNDSGNSKMLFDRINCHFAVHYMLRNDDCWTNFKANLNNHLRNGGYFLATTFDAEKVMNLLGTKDKVTQHYTDENGKSQMLFEIVKKYNIVDPKVIFGTGNAIDVFISWFSEEGRYLTEYLVDSRFFVNDLNESCGLELIDSDNFGNQMNMHQDYLTKCAKYEEVDETRQYLEKVSQFYESNSVNDGCKIWTSLFRYYVFRKVDKNIKPKQSGGDDTINFSDMEKFIVPNMKDKAYKNKEYSFINSIHHILKNHQIIPKINPQTLFNELGISMLNDSKLNSTQIKSIAKNINIEYDIEQYSHGDDSENSDDNKNMNRKHINKIVSQMITGLNVFIIERDCNDDYDIELIQKSKKINDTDQAVIIMKEGTLYVPVYMIDQETHERIGLYSMSHPIIKQMMNDL